MEDFITSTLQSWGYAGAAALMFFENVFPPIPSEVVMPGAGAAAKSGGYSLTLMILAGTVGSILGQLGWYAAARYVGTERFRRWVERHGHWLGATPGDVERADRWFDRYGLWAVTIGRLVPGVRTLISVPAGLSEMGLVRFLIGTSIGTTIWTALLAGVGYWLAGQRESITNVLNYVGMAVVGVLLAAFVWRVIRRRRELRRADAA
ncbi:DedA family protein [Alienimonas sp. DA493]|uniref:DedA family protein n=1 Tax=Alienimonas sp. DA493 TaxID=3373605 RepID=UPI003754CD5D